MYHATGILYYAMGTLYPNHLHYATCLLRSQGILKQSPPYAVLVTHLHYAINIRVFEAEVSIGRMPLMSPNQQCQSTEGTTTTILDHLV